MSKLEPFLDKARTTVDPTETLEIWTQIEQFKERYVSETVFNAFLFYVMILLAMERQKNLPI